MLNRLKEKGRARANIKMDKITNINKLEPKEIVERAISLELAGKSLEAIELLKKKVNKNFFVAGALAGRYKRMWLIQLEEQEGKEYGEQAKKTYSEAFSNAADENKINPACYNGINTAFMWLGLNKDTVRAREIAEQIKHDFLPKMQKDYKWRKAIEAETELHLQNFDLALNLYRKAPTQLNSREQSSMFQQAVWIARLLERNDIANQIELIMING